MAGIRFGRISGLVRFPERESLVCNLQMRFKACPLELRVHFCPIAAVGEIKRILSLDYVAIVLSVVLPRERKELLLIALDAASIYAVSMNVMVYRKCLDAPRT